jgi:predicted O-methyltransferase YrrM
MKREQGTEDIFDTVARTDWPIKPKYKGYGIHRSISVEQHREELMGLLREVKNINPETVVEIGTYNGGSFYLWCRCLDTAQKLISIDLPGQAEEAKVPLFRQFTPNKEARFIRENSHSELALESLKNTLDGDNIDFLFIDGDHSYEGVKQDFEMYSQFVAEDGIIAFHDICGYEWRSDRFGVDEFYSELQTEYDTTEIISKKKETPEGIGIVHL